MDENEFTIDFEIGITGESLGRLKLKELKEKIEKDIKEFFEKESNVSQYDLWQFETSTEYEKLE